MELCALSMNGRIQFGTAPGGRAKVAVPPFWMAPPDDSAGRRAPRSRTRRPRARRQQRPLRSADGIDAMRWCMQPAFSPKPRCGWICAVTSTGVHRANSGVKNEECGIPDTIYHEVPAARGAAGRAPVATAVSLIWRLPGHLRQKRGYTAPARARRGQQARAHGTRGEHHRVTGVEEGRAGTAGRRQLAAAGPGDRGQPDLTGLRHPPRCHRRDADLRRNRRRYPAG